MNAREATELGQRIAALVETGNPEGAYGLLAPVLAERTPFRLLGRIGEAVGAGPLEAVDPFLEHIAAEKTEGGWVVIGSALGQQLGRDPAGAFAQSRTFIIAADVWYGADILGERVPGPGERLPALADVAGPLARGRQPLGAPHRRRRRALLGQTLARGGGTCCPGRRAVGLPGADVRRVGDGRRQGRGLGTEDTGHALSRPGGGLAGAAGWPPPSGLDAAESHSVSLRRPTLKGRGGVVVER